MTSIIASGNETPRYPSVSAGVHKARCIKVIDLGTQKNDYQGQITWKRTVLISWETPEELDGEGKPMIISKFYNLSLHEKSTLSQDLTSWRGRPFTETEKKSFDISKLAGVPCTLNVIEKNGKSRISSVMPLAKNDKVAEQVLPTVIFSLKDFQDGKKETFNQLSEGIRNMILGSRELADMNQDLGDGNNGSDLNVGDEAIPF
jgi:hypothetical protein